jgi:hypothetical protein
MKKALLSKGLFYCRVTGLLVQTAALNIPEHLFQDAVGIAGCRGFFITVKDRPAGLLIGDINGGDEAGVIVGEGNNGAVDGFFPRPRLFFHDLGDVVNLAAVKGTRGRWFAKQGLNLDQAGLARLDLGKGKRIKLISMIINAAAAPARNKGSKCNCCQSISENSFGICRVHGIQH